MPLIQKPVTDTIGYNFETALSDARLYVEAFPMKSEVTEARVFFHAMLGYFKELGVGKTEREKIIEEWTAVEIRLWEQGWRKGWNSGLESAKRLTPPF